jgi:hypothetical protein
LKGLKKNRWTRVRGGRRIIILPSLSLEGGRGIQWDVERPAIQRSFESNK